MESPYDRYAPLVLGPGDDNPFPPALPMEHLVAAV